MKPSRLLIALTLPFTLLLLTIPATHADAPKAEAKAVKKRLFINGGWKTSNDAVPLMRYLIRSTGKDNPKVCLLPTASGDAAESIVNYYDIMNQLECRPRHLRLFAPSKVQDFEAYLEEMDAIYVGGGNTLNMLAIWKEQGIDVVLRKAYDRGVVLGGGSAGAICWFAQGCTDSRPGRLTAMTCLGWLEGSACPHFNLEKRRSAYQQMVQGGELKDGLAVDEGAGVLFEDGRLARVVSSVPKMTAYTVKRRGDKVVEAPLEAELLIK